MGTGMPSHSAIPFLQSSPAHPESSLVPMLVAMSHAGELKLQDRELEMRSNDDRALLFTRLFNS
jgi:hypothetical protein